MIHDLLREKDDSGNYTTNLLDNSESNRSDLHVFQAYGAQQQDGLANIFDVVVNSARDFGHESQEELRAKIDSVLNNEEWQQADMVLRAWDEKVRAQDFDSTVTGNPRMDSVEIDGETFGVMAAINTLKEANKELGEAINTDKFNLDFVFNTLVGDASPLLVTAHIRSWLIK